MNRARHLFNIVLPIAGIVIALLYSTCEDSCAFLRGSVFGLTLNYVGIFYMGVILFSNLLKRKNIALFLLSFGIGAEMYLLLFQVRNGVYCTYCLSFGTIIFMLFLFNFEKTKKFLIAVSLALGLIFFSVFFEGSVTPVYAEETFMPSIGSGQVHVRLYTDYFCNPCRALEPKLEPVIRSIVKKGGINITFIDTPIHPYTVLYAKYFFYMVNAAGDIGSILRARSVLFEAAGKNITDKERLESFIKSKDLPMKPLNEKPTFAAFSRYLKEDHIRSTPTCVIYQKGRKKQVEGQDIIKALEGLK